MKYIAYYRVSTEKQGQSGLGLRAQKQAVNSYIGSTDGELVGEYQDIESGTKLNRSGLAAAIDHCMQVRGTLVVKKLDRISREGFRLTSQLDDLGIPYIDADSPHDTALLKNIKVALAADEREKISERTTAALEQIKQTIRKEGSYTTRAGRQIKGLGHPSTLGGPKAIERSVASRRRKADNDPANIQATAVIIMMRENGSNWSQIMRWLNDNGFKTSRGNAYSVTQVKDLFKRACLRDGVPDMSDSD